jgi:hypothetical protein
MKKRISKNTRRVKRKQRTRNNKRRVMPGGAPGSWPPGLPLRSEAPFKPGVLFAGFGLTPAVRPDRLFYTLGDFITLVDDIAIENNITRAETLIHTGWTEHLQVADAVAARMDNTREPPLLQQHPAPPSPAASEAVTPPRPPSPEGRTETAEPSSPATARPHDVRGLLDAFIPTSARGGPFIRQPTTQEGVDALRISGHARDEAEAEAATALANAEIAESRRVIGDEELRLLEAEAEAAPIPSITCGVQGGGSLFRLRRS